MNPKFQRFFTYLDWALYVYFFFLLLRVWVAPNPLTAGDMLDNFSGLVVLEVIMIPFKMFIVVFGRKFGLYFSIFWYCLSLGGILLNINDTGFAIMLLFFLFSRMWSIYFNTTKAEKKLSLLFSVGALFILIFFWGIFSFLIPSFGLTEEFLNSIVYNTNNTSPKYTICLLLTYYISTIVIDYKLKKRFKEDELCHN
ncbi:hypothetical protein [Bacteroides sp. 224]|uniref:hypothetical protein n=1 Tax=Bacteroides sp. 224 TaxID=2302936 RepID=UPI0013D81797|nr:hypothetical protein [Bacteroides sp. 224]NDV65709.1 hypothetical protein [Bacteroides sp. 224]